MRENAGIGWWDVSGKMVMLLGCVISGVRIIGWLLGAIGGDEVRFPVWTVWCAAAGLVMGWGCVVVDRLGRILVVLEGMVERDRVDGVDGAEGEPCALSAQGTKEG